MRSLEIKKIALDFNNLKNSMENNNYCYIHVCNINNGLVILKELLDRIIKVSLDKKLEEIRVCILGPSNHSQISNIESYNPKIKVIYTNDNICNITNVSTILYFTI